ncbi:MAG: hypothetical protein ACU0BF_01690 [Paracoccaceae bacterium]
MLRPILFTTLIVTGTGAGACGLDVEAQSFDASVIEDRLVEMRAVNGTSFDLEAAEVEFTILGSDRPVPLYSASHRGLRDIAGGLLVGEEMVGTDYHFMDDRTKRLAADAPALTIEFTVTSITPVGGVPIPCLTEPQSD